MDRKFIGNCIVSIYWKLCCRVTKKRLPFTSKIYLLDSPYIILPTYQDISKARQGT